MEDKVTIICYGTKKVMERNEAIKEFSIAMRVCEGSERDRYTNIYFDLIDGKKVCRDV